MNDILIIKEVTTFIMIKKRKITYALIAQAKTLCFNAGCAWRIRRNEIEKWIDAKI
ncbi:MAG TPA: hypothetical protein P5280_10365 [Cyclobacteriaceae bacterium]|nr:hypothetical protein [Cyclobacteriaceae bacterium]